MGTAARCRTSSSESFLTDLSELDICSLHSQDSLSVMLDSASLSPLHPPSYLPKYSTLPAKSGRHGRTRAKDFLRRMETLGRSWTTPRVCPERRSVVIGRSDECEGLRMLHSPLVGNRNTVTDCPLFTSQSQTSTPTNLKDHITKLEMLSSAFQRRRSVDQRRSYDDLLVHVPKDHKLGTFPKTLSLERLTPDHRPVQDRRRRDRAWPENRRVSVYDNVPDTLLHASASDLLDPGQNPDPFQHLDHVLQHVDGLQRMVERWAAVPEGEGGREHGMTGARSSSKITLDLEGASVTTPRDGDTDTLSTRERRDSGVGASLTRPR